MKDVVSIKIYKDKNKCDVICIDSYTREKMQALVVANGATIVGKPTRKAFTFVTKDSSTKDLCMDKILDAVDEISQQDYLYRRICSRIHFWAMWAAFWGTGNLLLEFKCLYMGNLKDAALYGFVGAMVVLASLSNYWKYKKILKDFKDSGSL